MSIETLETRSRLEMIENPVRTQISDKAILSLDNYTCAYELDLMKRVAIDPEYTPYGVKMKKCIKCDGHQSKCPGYLRINNNTDLVNEVKKLYALRIESE